MEQDFSWKEQFTPAKDRTRTNEHNFVRTDGSLSLAALKERLRADIATRSVQRGPPEVAERPRPPRLQRHPPAQGCGASE